MKNLAGSNLRYRRRKIKNVLAIALLYLIAFVAIAPLFLIFSYVAIRGAEHLNLSFFTELPKAAGEMGGGMSNALVGSLVLVAMASRRRRRG